MPKIKNQAPQAEVPQQGVPPEMPKPMPKLFPEIKFFKRASGAYEELAEEVNTWMGQQKDAEIKDIKTIAAQEYIITQVIYVKYPK